MDAELQQRIEAVREEVIQSGCRVDWIGTDANGLVWAVVHSTQTGKRYKWPGFFAWQGPLPGETRSKPADQSTDPPRRQATLF